MATQRQEKAASKLVTLYDENAKTIENFGRMVYDAIDQSPILTDLVHSMKFRLKDRDHLKAKLIRKMEEAKKDKRPFTVDSGNFLLRVNDLAGVRVLHLHTRQVATIDKELRGIFKENSFELVEEPTARTWDDETREYFKLCGIKTQPSESMYTSVHYVVSSNSRATVTCEIQLRTLMEEVWGEVDHLLNYPVPSPILSSREQLKVLARVTASASRLVDSIILTDSDARK